MSDKTIPQFVLAAPKDFWWEVQIPIAVDNTYQRFKLDLLFAALEQAEIDKFEGKGLADNETAPTNDEICHRVVRGWRNLPDEQGNQVLFSPDALRQLLRVPMARESIVAHYLVASKGLAARKNG